MKRYVRSSYKKIDSVRFAKPFVDKLQELMPYEDQFVRINPQYTEITIENPSSLRDIYNYVIDAAESLGYRVITISDYDDRNYEIAVVNEKNESWVRLIIDFDDYSEDEPLAYIDIDYNTGNVLLEDWYEG